MRKTIFSLWKIFVTIVLNLLFYGRYIQGHFRTKPTVLK